MKLENEDLIEIKIDKEWFCETDELFQAWQDMLYNEMRIPFDLLNGNVSDSNYHLSKIYQQYYQTKFGLYSKTSASEISTDPLTNKCGT